MLTAADADGLRDLADRSERAAKTARRCASAADGKMLAMLTDLAARAEGVAFTAAAIAKYLDPDGEDGE